jgi:aspartyl-tRNA synthetase
LSNQQKIKLEEETKKYTKNDLIIIKIKNDKMIDGNLKDLFTNEEISKINDLLDLEKDDLLILSYGKWEESLSVLGRTRLLFKNFLFDKKLLDQNETLKKLCFLWVIDFPLFHWNEEENTFETMHNPFTSPNPLDIEYLKNPSDYHKIRGLHYDIVLNGIEIGGILLILILRRFNTCS